MAPWLLGTWTMSWLFKMDDTFLTAANHYWNQFWLDFMWSVAFTWERYHRECSVYLSLISVWKLLYLDYSLVSQRPRGWCATPRKSCINLGSDSLKRCHLTSIGNSIVEIRRSYDRLISIMGFPIPVRQHLYIESGPWTYTLEIMAST